MGSCKCSPFSLRLTTDANPMPGTMGQGPVQVSPDHRLPRLDQQLVRKGIPHPAPPSILHSLLRQEADQCRIHRIPQRRQVVHHQHAQEEGRLQDCPDPWRDQGVAVHHPHAPHLPHRLPWNRPPLGTRLGEPEGSQGSRQGRASLVPLRPHCPPHREGATGVPRANVRDQGLDRFGGLPRQVGGQDGQAASWRRGRSPYRRYHGPQCESHS